MRFPAPSARMKMGARPLAGTKPIDQDKLIFLNKTWFEGNFTDDGFRRYVRMSQPVIDRYLFQTREEWTEFKLKAGL